MARHKNTSNKTVFIEKAKKVHNDTYNYSLSEYVTAKQKMIIICKEHGEFLQNANNHLSGQDCPLCGETRTRNKSRKSVEKFIEEANIIHNNKFDYSLVDYINTDTKVTIICPDHGEFQQTPSNHLHGKECWWCKNVKLSNSQKKLNNGWNYSVWEKKGKESKSFDGFKCYIIKCFNESEEFYKIGKTFNKLTLRFSCATLLPYNYEVIDLIEGEAKEISTIERELHKIHKLHSYIPQIYFEGNSECFTKIEEEMIKNIKQTLKQL